MIINESKKLNEGFEKYNYSGERFLKHTDGNKTTIEIDRPELNTRAESTDGGKTWKFYSGYHLDGTETISKYSAGVDQDVADMLIQYAGLEW